MDVRWSALWRDLALRVELREAGGDEGSTLRIGPADGSLEWLRFDAFRSSPHWHLAPSAHDEIRPLDAHRDPVAEIFEMLGSGLPSLLERAGAGADVVSAVAEPGDPRELERLLLEAERAMRHRPARLDELDPRDLYGRRSEKWHTYPSDVLPAWVAEMDFPVAEPIRAELRRFGETSDVGYPIGLAHTGLPEVFAARMEEAFDWRPDPARVEILSEVVQGMYVALLAYAQEGEGAIVQTPIYPPFLTSVRETRRRLVENRMQSSDAGIDFDLDALERSVDPETRLLLFCNPHNPSGRVYSRAELERVARVAVEHDLVVVTDEIHGDLLFDGRRHLPLASLGPEIAERTVTLTSASKAWNIPGLRCAVAHFGSESLQRRFNGALPRHVRGGIGLFGLYATIAAWRFGQPWLEEVVPYLAANRDFAESALRERIPEIRFHRPEATYLAWLDCTALGLEGSPAAHFLQHGRVALSDGRVFGPGWERHARLNFATSRSILGEVIERMAKSLGR